MLAIRKEQMEVLSRAQEERFINDLMHYAKSEFPEETRELQDQDVRNYISAGHRKIKTLWYYGKS